MYDFKDKRYLGSLRKEVVTNLNIFTGAMRQSEIDHGYVSCYLLKKQFRRSLMLYKILKNMSSLYLYDSMHVWQFCLILKRDHF